jgi:hypothetical protein
MVDTESSAGVPLADDERSAQPDDMFSGVVLYAVPRACEPSDQSSVCAATVAGTWMTTAVVGASVELKFVVTERGSGEPRGMIKATRLSSKVAP